MSETDDSWVKCHRFDLWRNARGYAECLGGVFLRSRQIGTSSLSDLGVSHVIAGCLFLTRKSATVENARLAKFSAPKSDKLLD